MTLSRAEKAEAAATIFNEMINGSTDAEIMDLLGVDAETYNELRRYMLEAKSESLRTQPREHTFAEYLINQTQNVRDLTGLINNLDAKKQYNAIVGAIRVRADIYDKIIARGQEFGIIKKEPDRKEVVGGIVVADLSAADLKKAITGEMKSLHDMIGAFGEGDLKSLPSAPLHYGEAVTVESPKAPAKPKPEGKVKAKTGKRAAGRRRVIGKKAEVKVR